MSNGSVQVIGGARLRRTMKAAGAEMAELKAVHAAIADLVAQRSKPKTPRRSGRLQGTIRGNKAASRSVVFSGRNESTRYAAVPYAGPIHWGWPVRNIRPQPWIAQAAADSETQWLRIFEAGLADIISKVEGA